MAKAYKLFRLKNNQLYPLYVFPNEIIPMNSWLTAKCGELFDSTHVRTKIGNLALRPGFHLAEIPNSPWIGQKAADGSLLRRNDNVWCECEHSDNICYQDYVNEIGRNKKGIVIPKNAMMREIPIDGYYHYKTNPQGDVWIIAGAIKVNRILSNDEVEMICRENGVEPQKVA